MFCKFVIVNKKICIEIIKKDKNKFLKKIQTLKKKLCLI